MPLMLCSAFNTSFRESCWRFEVSQRGKTYAVSTGTRYGTVFPRKPVFEHLPNMMGSQELSLLLTVKCFTKLLPEAGKSTPVCGCWGGIPVTMSAGMNLSQKSTFPEVSTAVLRGLHRKASKESGSQLVSSLELSVGTQILCFATWTRAE